MNAHGRQWFDTSNYQSNNPSGIETGMNKTVLGMFQDECAGSSRLSLWVYARSCMPSRLAKAN